MRLLPLPRPRRAGGVSVAVDGATARHGPSVDLDRRLQPIWDALADRFGPQAWWPAAQAFEMIAGALLVQNTAWANAAAALANLEHAQALSVAGILSIPPLALEDLVRPSGYYRQKAAKLRAFAEHVRDHHHGDLDALLGLPMERLRAELLAIWGIGPEPADAIIFYAARQPSFGVDGYTRRVLARVGVIPADVPAGRLRAALMQAVPPDAATYGERHAWLVMAGRRHCRKAPLCAECPLLPLCRHGSGVLLR